MEVMETSLERKPWGWEYASENGNKYTVGQVTAEFNVVVDDFDDINKLFDCNALVGSHLVDYVYGDLKTDTDGIKNWLDWRISKYEKHERTVKFYKNHITKDNTEFLYECYIGTEEPKANEAINITKYQMYRMVKDAMNAIK